MNFDRPIDFRSALLMKEVRPFIPTSMSHEELEAIGHEIRERSLLMARVTNAEFGNRVLDLSNRIIEGNETEALARRKLAELQDALGYEPAQPGAITDLSSDFRLNLIVRMQVQMACGFGQWRMRQTPQHLEAFPCLEFYRAFQRKEPRDWPARWKAAGGKFFNGASDYPEGRMVAAVNSPIWTSISAFGTPYPPFDFNSGMDLRPVSRSDAVAIGAIHPSQVIPPQRRDFEKDAAAGVAGLSDDIERVLLESLGGGWEEVAGVLQKANEQCLNELLICGLNHA